MNPSSSPSLLQLRPGDTCDDVSTSTASDRVQSDTLDDHQEDEEHEQEHVKQPGHVDGKRAEPSTQKDPSVKVPSFVVDPVNLAEWRQRLFDLDEMVVMTNTE